MGPEDGRRESFFEHLDESEQRLGARRHSVFDGLFVGAIAVVVVVGFGLGVMRLRTTGETDQSRAAAPPSVPRSVSPPAAPTERNAGPVPTTAPSTTDRGGRSATSPAPAVRRSDDRPYVDASRPGQYTIKDPKVEVQIHTLSEKERDAKLEQLKKEGLLTEREIEALKAQTRSPR